MLQSLHVSAKFTKKASPTLRNQLTLSTHTGPFKYKMTKICKIRDEDSFSSSYYGIFSFFFHLFTHIAVNKEQKEHKKNNNSKQEFWGIIPGKNGGRIS